MQPADHLYHSSLSNLHRRCLEPHQNLTPILAHSTSEGAAHQFRPCISFRFGSGRWFLTSVLQFQFSAVGVDSGGTAAHRAHWGGSDAPVANWQDHQKVCQDEGGAVSQRHRGYVQVSVLLVTRRCPAACDLWASFWSQPSPADTCNCISAFTSCVVRWRAMQLAAISPAIKHIEHALSNMCFAAAEASSASGCDGLAQQAARQAVVVARRHSPHAQQQSRRPRTPRPPRHRSGSPSRLAQQPTRQQTRRQAMQQTRLRTRLRRQQLLRCRCSPAARLSTASGTPPGHTSPSTPGPGPSCRTSCTQVADRRPACLSAAQAVRNGANERCNNSSFALGASHSLFC